MDIGDFDGREVESVDEKRKFLDRDHLVSFNSVFEVARDVFFIIVDFVAYIPNSDLRQELIVDVACFDLALEECEEHLPELVYRNEAFFILNHLVQLLLQVVENTIVHDVTIDLTIDRHLITCLAPHDFIEVLVDYLATYRHGSFLASDFLERLFSFESLR